jgi:hypothetical protein
MLEMFLNHAVSKREACQFILDQVSEAPLNALSPEQVLRSIKSDLTAIARKGMADLSCASDPSILTLGY